MAGQGSSFIFLSRAAGSGYTFVNSEAAALAARFTIAATNARKSLIDNLVGALKTAGVWTKLDALYVIAAADSQAAQRNWIADLYNLTEVGGLTFTADRQYVSDGTSGYLETGFNPSTAGGLFIKDSAHLGVWIRDNIAVDRGDLGNSNAQMNSKALAGGVAMSRLNSATASSFAVASSVGHTVANRPDSANQELYRDGSSILSAAQASSSVTSATFNILRRNGGSSTTRQTAAAHFGSSLTSANVLALYNAINTYLAAVGAV